MQLSSTDFQKIFESSPDLYLVLLPDLRIIGASDAYLAATFTRREQIIGRNIFDVFPDNPNEPAATGVKHLRASLQNVLANRKPHTMAVQKYDIRKPNGEFEVRYWSPLNTPVLNSKREVIYIIHKAEDVTDFLRIKRDREKQTVLTDDLQRRIEEMETDIIQRAQDIQKLNEELQSQVDEKTFEIRAIFERISDGFIALDNNRNFIYANKQAENELGMNASELYGRNIMEVFPTDVQDEAFVVGFNESLESREYRHLELYSELYKTWFEIHLYPSASGISVFFRDISDRKKAEERLRASEQKYKLLFDRNPLPMWMLSMPDRNFIAVNESAIQHYGYSREEFLSMNASQIRPAEDVPQFLAQAYSPQGIKNSGIWRHIKKDGTIIRVEIITHDIKYEGNQARLVLANDITERLKAEEALRQSEEINRLIMSSSLNAIICMNTDDKIIYWNPRAEKVFGWEKEEILGRRLADTIFPGKNREQYKSDFRSFLETGESPLHKKLVEISAINKNGVEFFIELAIIPVKESDKEFYCCFIQDINERKKAEEQLKQSHEELRQLALHLQDIREEEQKRIAREVHDELGQQITGLKMDIAWIWKKLHGIKDVVPIEEKLKEMTLLLDSAVQTIRKIASELRPSILDDLGVVAALEWQSNEFQKRFRVPVDFRTSVAYLDLDAAVATGLFRLYQESLTNVARHAQASCVVATLDVSASHVILEITDDGKGFDTQKTEGRKTLGLLGMKERVLMMNGDLNIISKPGKGTRVVITVPLVEETLSQPQHQ